ncbi:DUF6266 family protein [Olivibacter domesticus]|nr:DUF6266 family protein [Olivibacter domesticus]
MAKFINMTCFSGSVGGFVGCMGPFGFYVRSKPKKSLKPPTAGQLATRAKMALVGGYLKPLKEMVYLGFAASYKVKSKTAAMNMAVAHAMHNAIGGTYPDLSIKPEQIVLSRGKVPKLWKPQVQLQGKQLHVTWRPLANFCSFADDCVYVLGYNVKAKTVAVREAVREAASVTIDLEAEPPGSTVHLYVCVSNRESKLFSNSQYLGEF